MILCYFNAVSPTSALFPALASILAYAWAIVKGENRKILTCPELLAEITTAVTI